jgi:hypothetical protein
MNWKEKDAWADRELARWSVARVPGRRIVGSGNFIFVQYAPGEDADSDESRQEVLEDLRAKGEEFVLASNLSPEERHKRTWLYWSNFNYNFDGP